MPYLILEKMHHGVEGVWMGLGLAAGRVGNQCSLGLSESGSVTSDSLQPHGLYSPWNSPGQNTGVGSDLAHTHTCTVHTIFYIPGTVLSTEW